MPFDVDGARKAGYSDDDILKHLTESRKFDVEGAKKAGYSASDMIGYLSAKPGVASAPPAASSNGSGGESFLQKAGQFGVGAIKGLGHTANNLSDIGRVISGGALVDTALYKAFPRSADARKKFDSQLEQVLTPTNAAQRWGHGVEQVAEFFVPVPGSAEVKAAETAPKWIKLLVNAGRDAVDIGMKEFVHTKDPEAALKAAGLGAAGSAAIRSAPALGRGALAASKLPVVREIPGVGVIRDALQLILKKEPSLSPQKIALKLYQKANNGKLPETPEEMMAARQLYRDGMAALKPKRAPKGTPAPPLQGHSLRPPEAAPKGTPPPPLQGHSVNPEPPSPRGRMQPPGVRTMVPNDPAKSPSWNEANRALHAATESMGGTHETVHNAYIKATGKTSLADASVSELRKMYESLTGEKFVSKIKPPGTQQARR